MEFRDLKTQYNRYKTEIDEAIQGVALNSDFIMGKKVAELEHELAKYVGVRLRLFLMREQLQYLLT